jgi:hypothetical protein
MYDHEKRYLEWLVLQRQDIETGGDLFGLWQKKDVVIVQLVLGPGNEQLQSVVVLRDVNYGVIYGRLYLREAFVFMTSGINRGWVMDWVPLPIFKSIATSWKQYASASLRIFTGRFWATMI